MNNFIVYVKYTLSQHLTQAIMNSMGSSHDISPIIMLGDRIYYPSAESWDDSQDVVNRNIIIQFDMDLPYNNRELLKLILTHGGLSIRAGFQGSPLNEYIVNNGGTIVLGW